MTTDPTSLAELVTKNLKSMTISACGQWITFTTESGEQINFNSNGVISVSEDYRREYSPPNEDAVTFALRKA
jgi:hypothetical protein